MKFKPVLDKNFHPMIKAFNDYKKSVKKSGDVTRIILCVERNDGYNYIFRYDAYKDNTGYDNINIKIADRLAKTILWLVGGYKIYVAGSPFVYERLKKAYSAGGSREFDAKFMSNVYEKDFEVVFCEYDKIPQSENCSVRIGRHLDGCRIGFDAGGSDRKVSAVIDGEVIYSEEVIWHPKTVSNPDYHYNEILKAWETAASKMPRVDAIGVSSAGIYINNKIRVASLFIKVGKNDFDKKVKNMYTDLAKQFNVPLEVVNDGDVTALAGSMDLNDNNVLGIAMGTSEAVGYINGEGNFNNWLSELAFVPVDFNENAMVDEWSGDYGCGVKYFSQDGVIKLAENGGLKFEENLTPAEKLKVVQNLLKRGDALAEKIFADIGIYLGYTLPYYALFYDIKHVLILGRVTSGKGGDIILSKAKEVLREEFPSLANINLTMPDEKSRRVGQSIAAASLPQINREA